MRLVCFVTVALVALDALAGKAFLARAKYQAACDPSSRRAALKNRARYLSSSLRAKGSAGYASARRRCGRASRAPLVE